MNREPPPPRIYVGGVAVEHVRDGTYRVVDPITGKFLRYLVGEYVEYESTIEAQIRKNRQ